MPVDQNQNIEAEYLEDSWAMMNELLDKELPLADNKPMPPSKNWLTVLLLLLFAWTTYLYWPEDFYAEKEQLPQNEQPQQENSADNPMAALNNLEANKLVASISEPQQSQSQIEGDLIVESILLEKEVKDINSEPNRISRIAQPKVSIDLSNNSSILKPSIDVEQAVAIQENMSIDQKVVQSFNRDHTELITVLSAKNSLLMQNKEEEARFELIDPNANKKYWRASVKLEGIVDRRLPSGNFVGIQLSRELSNQFAFQIGLGLSRYRKLNPAENSFDTFSDVLGVVVSSNEDDQSALNAGLPIKYDDDDDKVSVIGINKVNYISVPLELTFAVNKKLGVVVGAGISYLISAEFSSRSNDHTWKSHEDGQTVNNEELLGTALSRFDIAPSIGFEFNPFDRIAIDLKFRNGLIDISKDKFLGFQEFHSNRYLHLGVAYDLFKF